LEKDSPSVDEQKRKRRAIGKAEWKHSKIIYDE
jgi:hypothetical protein